MSSRRRALPAALSGLALAAAVLSAAPAPAEPPPPSPTYPAPPPPPPNAEAMTPAQPAVLPGDPAAAPPPPPPGPPGVPEIPNPQYGSGKYGGGILGTLRDLWDTARNPAFAQDQFYGEGARPAPPPGAGPAPQLPPGYVSTNAPGSEAPMGVPGESDAGRPALPPGYYPLDGPPPPGYFDAAPGVPYPVLPSTAEPAPVP